LTNRTFLLLAIAIVALPVRATTIEQWMLLDGDSQMQIHVWIHDSPGRNLSLTWPLSLLPKPGNGSGTLISFNIRFPLKEGNEHVFPVARHELRGANYSLKVMLPEGWTGVNLSAGGEKRYDTTVQRIGLFWDTAREEGCTAILRIPGSSNGGLRENMRWILLRGYLLATVILGSVVIAAFLLLRVFR
jgi:hypothetical protein